MAKDLNKVMIIGRLGTEPEMRYTPSGSPVTTFRVASSRQWKDSNGEPREDTEWFSIVTWNKLAEICNQYLSKGARVYLEGRLQTRSWEDHQTGHMRYKTEVVASDMIILESRTARENASGSSNNYEPPSRDRDTSRSSSSSSSYRSYDPPPDIGDEDIPF